MQLKLWPHNPLKATSRHSQRKPSRTQRIPIEEDVLALISACVSLMAPIGVSTREQRGRTAQNLFTYQRPCPTRHAVLQSTRQYSGPHSAKATCGPSPNLRSCLRQIVWAKMQSGTIFPPYEGRTRYPEKTNSLTSPMERPFSWWQWRPTWGTGHATSSAKA